MGRLSRLPALMSGPELAAYGYYILTDHGGVIPKVCAFCRRPASLANPMSAQGTARDPHGNLRGNLMRTKCRICHEATSQRPRR